MAPEANTGLCLRLRSRRLQKTSFRVIGQAYQWTAWHRSKGTGQYLVRPSGILAFSCMKRADRMLRLRSLRIQKKCARVIGKAY